MGLKKFVIVLGLVVWGVQFAAGQVTFQKTCGGSGYSVGYSMEKTNDSGFVITGWTSGFGAGGTDIYLIRIDPLGDTLWTKTYGGSGNERGYSVRQTTDRGFIIAGNTTSFGAGSTDIYLVKTDSLGNLLWSRTYGGNNFEETYCVRQTFDGGYIIIGYTNSFGQCLYDLYLIKTDANGSVLWSKTYGTCGQEQALYLTEAFNGGFIIVGESDNRFLVMKTNENGDSLWTKRYGGTFIEDAYVINKTLDSGYVVLGITSSFGAGSYDLYLIKIDSVGTIIWSKTYGTPNYEFPGMIFQTRDGGFVISAESGNYPTEDNFLIRLNSNGDTLWTKTYGGATSDGGNDVEELSDKGFLITGYTTSFGSNALHLIKTDSTGNSGCKQSNDIHISLSSPNTLVSAIRLYIDSGVIVGNPVTVEKSGGNITILCSTIGVEEISFSVQFTVYPNPTTSSFTISFNEESSNRELEITDVAGRVVYQQAVNHNSEIIHQNFSAGVYVVRVSDRERVSTQKLIIQ